jgi:hypothetical protein
MNAHSLKASLSEYDAWLSFFEAKLRPIATRPVDINQPDWPEQFKKRPRPLDEADIRADAENVLAAVTELYASNPAARQPIRDMFTRYRSVNWAVWPSQEPTSEEGFRSWLLRISIEDQGRDTRDTLTTLWRVCREAEDAGVKIQPILESVAAMSSDANRHGWGSLRKMLLKAPLCCRSQSWAIRE